MKSIVLLLPYWGAFPNYFPLFLESVKRNDSIDFVIITDDRRRFNYPNNVKVVYCSFYDFKSKVQSAFDFPISYVSTAYKMCSVRTIWGYALPHYIEGYDYWGFCDCDVILGDIRHFFPDSLLSRYDRLLSRAHLTLYRNSKEVNSAFIWMSQGTKYDWRELLSQPANRQCVCFDEWGGTSALWSSRRPEKFYDEIIFDDINWRYKHFVPTQMAKQLAKEGKSHFIYWYHNRGLNRVCLQSGKVLIEPICYAHFQKRHLDICESSMDYENYLIVPNSFIPYEDISIQKLRFWGRRRLVNLEYFARRFRNLLRKMKQEL